MGHRLITRVGGAAVHIIVDAEDITADFSLRVVAEVAYMLRNVMVTAGRERNARFDAVVSSISCACLQVDAMDRANAAAASEPDEDVDAAPEIPSLRTVVSRELETHFLQYNFSIGVNSDRLTREHAVTGDYITALAELFETAMQQFNWNRNYLYVHIIPTIAAEIAGYYNDNRTLLSLAAVRHSCELL